VEEEGLYLRFLSARDKKEQVRRQDFPWRGGGLSLKLHIFHVSFKDYVIKILV
jgi:hypothetical protein